MYLVSTGIRMYQEASRSSRNYVKKEQLNLNAEENNNFAFAA